jgi:hypothetical protein
MPKTEGANNIPSNSVSLIFCVKYAGESFISFYWLFPEPTEFILLQLGKSGGKSCAVNLSTHFKLG